MLSYQEKVKYFYDDDPYSDPPDIYDLYRYYNHYFFQGLLEASTIKWSTRMTLCAGTCKYEGHHSCTITLSEPLLKFRTHNELKETVLHEMIHAYLFITDPESCKVDEGHGPKFLDIMHNLNQITGLRVTVYHQFHDEVDRCRQHIWKCDGPCQQKPPFFGVVKRSMNRAPQKADNWFERHQRECGGTFHKISEPEVKKKEKKREKKEKKEKPKQKEKQKQSSLDGFLRETCVEVELRMRRCIVTFQVQRESTMREVVEVWSKIRARLEVEEWEWWEGVGMEEKAAGLVKRRMEGVVARYGEGVGSGVRRVSYIRKSGVDGVVLNGLND